jgi:SpoVK/Ycf46/Vps4 family AAA+-type ATPase
VGSEMCIRDRLSGGDKSSNGIIRLQWVPRSEIAGITFNDAVVAYRVLQDIKSAFTKFNNPTPRETALKIPSRLTLLLSGPPGFGKSTFVTAIAHEHKLNVYATSLAQLTDASIPFLFDSLRAPYCLLLEDIDSMQNRESVGVGAGAGVGTDVDFATGTGISSRLVAADKKVSLSALLNVIDGTYADSKSIIIMTTNYPERLDAALIRPERVHLHVRFGPSEEVYKRWTRRFYPDVAHDSPYIANIVNEAMRRSTSTAELQSIFRRHDQIEDAEAEFLRVN